MSGISGKRMAVAGVVILLTGCGAGEAAAPTAKTSPATSAASSPPSPTSPTSSASPAASAPSATPSPRAKSLPRAKDGKRLQACFDGTCEVVVSDGKTIRLNGRWGLSPIKINVQDGYVDFYAVTSSGMQVSMREQRPDQGGPSKIDDLSFEVLAVQGKRAVIKIAH